ncbi:MAG: hypothetical protein IPH95_00085 [Candidatus Promineofilum sp.]|nr:hypothetical protein [Promineifilum sp.]
MTFADQLTALSLQLQAFSSDSLATATPYQSQTYQLQINGSGGDLTTSDRGIQIQLLDNLARTVESRLATTATQLPELETRC